MPPNSKVHDDLRRESRGGRRADEHAAERDVGRATDPALLGPLDLELDLDVDLSALVLTELDQNILFFALSPLRPAYG